MIRERETAAAESSRRAAAKNQRRRKKLGMADELELRGEERERERV